jgi:hypothetical protein
VSEGSHARTGRLGFVLDEVLWFRWSLSFVVVVVRLADELYLRITIMLSFNYENHEIQSDRIHAVPFP